MTHFFQKIRGFFFSPRSVWEAVSDEETSVRKLFTGYILLLAAIPAVASVIGWSVIGIRIPFSGVYRFTFFEASILAVLGYALHVGAVAAIGKLIQKTAAVFDSNSDAVPAFKLSAGIHTPYLAAGILYLVPNLGILVYLAGLYGFYLLWVGLPAVLDTPPSKAPAFMAVLVLTLMAVHILLQWILGIVVSGFGPALPPV